jgi:hypothetical protein
MHAPLKLVVPEVRVDLDHLGGGTHSLLPD